MKYAIGVNICPTKTSGLCNQLYRILAAIQFASNNNIPIVCIDKFYKQINSDVLNAYCNISEVINMEKFNELVFNNYGVVLVDINHFNFKIKKLSYGIDELNIDVTNEIVYNFFKNNRLEIYKDYNFNYLYKIIQKISNQNKQNNQNNLFLMIILEVNGMNIKIKENIINNTLEDNIIIDFSTIEFIPYGSYDQNQKFVDIMRNIPFADNILNKASDYINKVIKQNDKLNCIHLRLEEDAIIHWSKENNINEEDYKKLVEFNYIKTIKENIDKTIPTIILGSDYNNAVVEYMKQNDYNIILTPKFSKEREISAIIDMHIGEECTHKYIFLFESSFSFTLLCRIKNKKNFNAVMINFNKLLKN